MTGPARDGQRQLVYAAEQLVHRTFERANAAGADPTVELYGSRIALPAERRFGDLASVQNYADRVLGLDWVAARWPRAHRPLRVRERAGTARAHYERDTEQIAVPIRADGRWALRELVILHELAHHLEDDPRAPAHGPAFTGRLCALAGGVLGPEAEFLLNVTYRQSGVEIG